MIEFQKFPLQEGLMGKIKDLCIFRGQTTARIDLIKRVTALRNLVAKIKLIRLKWSNQLLLPAMKLIYSSRNEMF